MATFSLKKSPTFSKTTPDGCPDFTLRSLEKDGKQQRVMWKTCYGHCRHYTFAATANITSNSTTTHDEGTNLRVSCLSLETFLPAVSPVQLYNEVVSSRSIVGYL